MDLLSVKLIVLVLMGFGRICCGMLPLAIVKIISGRWSKSADRRLKKVISVLIFFGGGVMLATCFLHMMPEVQESFNEALPDAHLPYPQIIFVGGFFLVYFIEDIVHALIHKRMTAKKQRKNKKQGKKGSAGPLVAVERSLPYNNNDSNDSTPISVIGSRKGDYLNGGMCYANNITTAASAAGDHYRKQELTGRTTPPPRETKELFDKSIVRKCDDIPGLPKDRIISTTNIQSKPQDIIPGGNSRSIGSGLLVGVEKFSYIDPDWFRDTVIANSQANLLGGASSTPSIVDSRGSSGGKGSKSLHDLHLNKSQTGTTISDDSNSSNSSGSTSCSRKKLHDASKKGDKKEDLEHSFHAHHQHEDDEDDDHSSDHFHQDHHEHSHIPVAFIEGDDELDQTIGAEIRNLLIVIAISFHAVFEGMAIGLQETEKDVWYMFFAVSLHECTILFCIGVELISNKTKVFRMVLYVLIVSLVSPIGIAIGIVVTERSFGPGDMQTLVVGCFQASFLIINWALP